MKKSKTKSAFTEMKTGQYTFVFLTLLLIVLFIFRISLIWGKYQPESKNISYRFAFENQFKEINVVDSTVKKLLPEPQASLLSGILVGIRAQMPKELYLDLQKTGTIHMIALSGTNIAFLVNLLGGFFHFLGKKRAGIVSILGIVFFIIFVGPSASVVRAGLMASFQVFAMITGRKYYALWGLLASGLVMISISPKLIFHPGFQLSFAATLGLIVLGSSENKNRQKNLFSKVSWELLNSVRTTLAAQMFTVPIVLFHFYQVSIIAPVSNILTIWTIPYLMILGFVVVFVHILSFGVVNLSFLIYPFLFWFVFAVEKTASLPFAGREIKGFGLGWFFTYYSCLFFLLVVIYGLKRK